MKQKNLLVTFIAALGFEILNTLKLKPLFFWLFFSLFIVLISASIFWAMGLPIKKWLSKEFFKHSVYLILPLAFFISGNIFLILLESYKQIIIIAYVIIFFLIMMGIRGIILNLEYKIKPRLTYNILISTTIITAFLGYATIWAFYFYFYFYFNFSVYLMLSLIFIFTAILFYQLIHLTGILGMRTFIFALIASLLITEIAWLISFWPVEYIFSALLILVCFYVMWGVMHHKFEETLTKRLLFEYLIIGSVKFFILLKYSSISLGIRGY